MFVGSQQHINRSGLRIVAFRDDDKELRKGKAGPRTRDRAAGERGTQGKKTDAFGRPFNGKNIATGRSYDQMDPAGKRLENASRQLNKFGRKVQRGVANQDYEAPIAENSPLVYVANAAILAGAAGIAAASPEWAAKVVVQPGFLAGPDGAGLIAPIVQILSLGLSAAAVTNYVQSVSITTVSGGAASDQLDDTLHKRLNAALSTFSIAQLGLLGLALSPLSPAILAGYNGSSVLNGTGIGVLGLGVAIQLYVAGVNYARNAPEGYNAINDTKTWVNDAVKTFNGVDGGISAGYAVLTASLLAAGLGYIFAPLPTLAGVFGPALNSASPASLVLWQLVGAGVAMIVAPITYSLKEAAAANCLSDPRYKLLNIALFTAGAGHWLVLQPRLADSSSSGPLLPIVLGTWAIAAVLGGFNLLQKSKRNREV
eukprot:gene7828-8025_t